MPVGRIATKRAVIDTGLFQYPGPRLSMRQHRVLLYVGRYAPEKNLEFLLRTFARIEQDRSNPRALLAMVGYGPLEDRLRALASDLGLDRTVQFWGAAAQADLPAFYRCADALVLPSLHETWGLVVLEAMACGLPVLISDRCGCTADVVTPETGWTFDPHDAGTLLHAFHDFLDRPDRELEHMGERAALIAGEYSPENSARIVMASVESVLREHSSLIPATDLSEVTSRQ
jgi:1,2-diacylglycerol 3-alpha-glucosyltransferase